MPILRIVLSTTALALALAWWCPPDSAWAQNPPAPSLAINQVDATGYPTIRAVVTALDPSGVPAQGLTAAQFQAFDGNAPVPITAVQSAQDASLRLSVVMVIDISGSMAGQPLVSAKQAATDFVESLGPNDEAAVVAFNADVTLVSGFTGDKATLADGIATLRAGGGTALYEAVQTAAVAAHGAESPRRAVVLLTDGENDTIESRATADGSTTAAQGAAVPVFTVGFGAAPDAAYLQGLAAATQGGYRPATAANVGRVYADIATLLRNQYVLSLRAPAAADGEDATLRITAAIGVGTAAANASFKRGVAPAVAATQAPQPETPTPAAKSTGGSNMALIVVAATGVAASAGGVIVVALAAARRRRTRRHQLSVVAANPALAAAQGVPETPGTGALSQTSGTGTGRLVEQTADGTGRVFDLQRSAVIGSALSSTIVLKGRDVAPEHARIWLRDGRYLLHHAAGFHRKTYVGGREADWVVLEAGDDIRVGDHTLRFEDIKANGEPGAH